MKKLGIFIIVSLFFGLGSLLAQPFNPPGGVGTGGPIGDPVGVPIDGGLSVLIVAGVGYAGKKLRDKKKKEQEEN